MPCSNGFCIMPFPKQPSKDAAVEQWISPWWWLWWSNQTHLIFVFCHNPTSFVADNVSEPFTVWISISQPTGAAGNKEDFLQCMRNQRQTFRKNKIIHYIKLIQGHSLLSIFFLNSFELSYENFGILDLKSLELIN